jgi:hypothetical protein
MEIQKLDELFTMSKGNSSFVTIDLANRITDLASSTILN